MKCLKYVRAALILIRKADGQEDEYVFRVYILFSNGGGGGGGGQIAKFVI